MKKENLLESKLQEIPKDIEEFVSLSFDISDRIRDLLEQQNLSQKEFAGLLGKRESEVSKWLKGTHNFTLETIAKISVVFKAKLLYVPSSATPIDSLKEAMKDFEMLCKNKTLEDQSSDLKFNVLQKPALYDRENGLVFNIQNNDLNRSSGMAKYNIAASINVIEPSEEVNKYTLV